MEWTWSWWVFVPAVIIFTIMSQFARGAMNAQNIARFGPYADYRRDIGGAIFGSIVAGAILAAVITAVLGFAM